MKHMPFTNYDQPLRKDLALNYIFPVAKWLMRGDKDKVLATIGNSSWEAALTILFLLDTLNILEQGEWATAISGYDEFIKEINHKIKTTGKWLIEQAVREAIPLDDDVETRIHWDNLTWDTSVVLRAQLAILNKYGHKLTYFNDVEECLGSGISWLTTEFDSFLNASYTAGPQDAAEILILLSQLEKQSPSLYQRIVNKSSWKGREKELEWKVVEYLIKTRTEARQFPLSTQADEKNVALWWGEYFGTAEVLDGLLSFYKRYSENLRSNPYTERQILILQAIKETLVQGVYYFDYTQKDGTWGSAITDTARVATTYIKLTASLPSIQANPFVAFKALRWLCADSQILKDGSFLHSLFLTIYYAFGIMAYYNFWDLAKDQVAVVYDTALSAGYKQK